MLLVLVLVLLVRLQLMRVVVVLVLVKLRRTRRRRKRKKKKGGACAPRMPAGPGLIEDYRQPLSFSRSPTPSLRLPPPHMHEALPAQAHFPMVG